jgi:beta-glucanase (GH16 family)
MRLPLSLSLFLILAACAPAAAVTPTQQPGSTPAPTAPPLPSVTPSGEWTLVWSDEFDRPNGTLPDQSKWTAMTGGGGWGNGEWQNYTERVDNAYHENSMLVIKAMNEDYKGNRYTSARLVTRGMGDWTYGRVEVRAKVPIGQAIWPAIWMMPTDSEYGGWPASGEIDIMELIGKEPDTIHGTLHYGKPHEFKGSIYQLPTGQTYADDFHIFAIEWEPGEIRWYMDGYHYHSMTEWFTSSTKGQFPAPFDKDFYLILNIAVGGTWPGLPDETTPEEALMYVDYVRVFQR